jgi:hypothetical protein
MSEPHILKLPRSRGIPAATKGGSLSGFDLNQVYTSMMLILDILQNVQYEQFQGSN